MKNDAIYKVDRAGLQGPLLHLTSGVLSSTRQCRRRRIPEWHSGHGAVPSGHFASEDLSGLQLARRRSGAGGVTHWKILLPLRET